MESELTSVPMDPQVALKVSELIRVLYETPPKGETHLLIPIVGGPCHGEFVETTHVLPVHQVLREGQIDIYRLETAEDGLVYRYKEDVPYKEPE